jgi:catalase
MLVGLGQRSREFRNATRLPPSGLIGSRGISTVLAGGTARLASYSSACGRRELSYTSARPYCKQEVPVREHMLLVTLVVLGLACPAAIRAQDQPIEEQIVDAMNKAFGTHPGFRANHAKGIVVEGSFKASPEAAGLSRAVLFNGGTIPVTVRFSDSTGIPNVPDGSKAANPHGMAIKFHLPDGRDTDMVINSLKFFPVSTGEDFRDLLLASAASPPDAAKPTKFDQFVASHPSVPAAFATAATPDSFADEEYYGINAFVFINKAGERQAVRYQMVPERTVHLDADEAAKRPPDFLMDELPERLKRGPVTFHLKAQLAAAGDSTKDATKPWPDSRKIADLGVLTVTKAVTNSAEVQKTLLFLPGQLTDGIEQSDDPLIDVRNGAYAVSFSRRNP